MPEDVYSDDEAAIIRYAQKSTRLEPIDDVTYGDLAGHFSTEQIIDICLTIGLTNVINRFHATFQADVDETALKEVADGNAAAGSCPIALPSQPDSTGK